MMSPLRLLTAIPLLVPATLDAQSVVRPGRSSEEVVLLPSPGDLAGSRAGLPYPAALQNPGFEEGEGSFPSGWFVLRDAFWDREPALARTGRGSIRSNANFYLYQKITAPVDPFQTVAVYGHVWSREALETPRSTIIWLAADDSTVVASEATRMPLDVVGRWVPTWSAHRRPPGGDILWIGPGSRFLSSWLRWDDMQLFSEGFHFPGSVTGEPWMRASGESAAVPFNISAGGVVAQRVAGGSLRQEYFVVIEADFATTATLAYEERWLARAGTETTTTLQAEATVSAGSQRRVLDVGRPAGSGNGLVEARLSVTASATITHTSRGFASAEPRTIVVGPNSPDEGLRLVAAWPPALDSATVKLERADGSVVREVDLARHGTTVEATHRVDDLAAGEYRAVFDLRAADERTARIERPFAIVRESDAVDVPPFVAGDFPRVGWVWLLRETTDEAIFRAIRQAREDGFEIALVFIRLDQRETLRAACEAEAMPFIVGGDEIRNLYFEFVARDVFSKVEYLDRMRDLLGPLPGSSFYRGAYVMDEPFGEKGFDRIRRTMLALAQSPDLGQGFTILTPDFGFEPFLPTMQPNVTIVDPYPFLLTRGGDVTANLLRPLGDINRWAKEAATRTRELWLTPQAFEAVSLYSPYHAVPNSMHRAQLGAGVLAGAKGYLPFTLTAIDSIEGLRERDGTATQKLDEYRRFNALMARLGSVVRGMPVPDLRPGVPSPFAVSSAADAQGDRTVFVLNADAWTTRTLRLRFAAATGPVEELVAQRVLVPEPDGAVDVPLEPGGWAMLPVGDTVLTSVEALTAPPLALGNLTLPVLDVVTVTGRTGAPLGVSTLDLREDGTAFLAGNEVWFDVAPSPLFTRGEDGRFRRTGDGLRFSHQRPRFLPDGSVLGMHAHRGAESLSFAGVESGETLAWLGRTGGASDWLETPTGDIWVAADIHGVQRLRRGPAGLEPQALSGTAISFYQRLFGPFEGNRVAALVFQDSLRTITPGAETETSHNAFALPRQNENAAMNDAGVLAVPRMHRGATLVRLDQAGTVVAFRDFSRESVEATATAWVSPSVVAVADTLVGVRFYRVAPDLTTAPLGVWRPGSGEPILIRALDCEAGVLVVGLQDGRVFVVDGRAVGTGVGGWLLRGTP